MSNDLRGEIKIGILEMFDRVSCHIYEIASKLDEVYDGKHERPGGKLVEFVKNQLESYKNQESDSGLLIKEEMATYLEDRITDIYEKPHDPELMLARISEVFGEENAKEVLEMANQHIASARVGFEDLELALAV